MGDGRRMYDITVPIRGGMVVYEGDPDVSLVRATSLAEGHLANVSRLELGVHTGTHVDAPVHFIDGRPGVDAVPLDALIGPAQVVDATRLDGHIDATIIGSLSIDDGTQRILFKTRNSQLWERAQFAPDFVGLTEDAARTLIDRGVRLVGIDYLSIAPKVDPAPTHRVLLDAGVVIVEGLDLLAVPSGTYELICLPLRIVDCDGAPARAVLRELR